MERSLAVVDAMRRGIAAPHCKLALGLMLGLSGGVLGLFWVSSSFSSSRGMLKIYGIKKIFLLLVVYCRKGQEEGLSRFRSVTTRRNLHTELYSQAELRLRRPRKARYKQKYDQGGSSQAELPPGRLATSRIATKDARH